MQRRIEHYLNQIMRHDTDQAFKRFWEEIGMGKRIKPKKRQMTTAELMAQSKQVAAQEHAKAVADHYGYTCEHEDKKEIGFETGPSGTSYVVMECKSCGKLFKVPYQTEGDDKS